MMTRPECASFFRERDHFCILTHQRPDGDTLGSAAALCLGLRSLGKTAHILENPEISPSFHWLHAGLTKTEPAEGDTVLSVDVSSPGMLPKAFAPLVERTVLRIDHHASGISFTPRELVDPTAGACAEIIHDILRELAVDLSPAMADALYVGISTDTGCFRFANTTAHTFTVAAACAQRGARVYELNQTLFESNTLTKLRMQAWIVENMHVFGDGKLAIVAIPRAVEDLIGVTDDDMDNMSSFPRTVAGVCMAATLRQTKNGDTKISLRAVPGMDATVVCGHFGGGGHKGAAGATTSLSLEETAKALEEIMLRT